MKKRSVQNQKRLMRANEIFNQFVDTIQGLAVTDSFCKVIDLIKNCKGKIITTGMGKAGLAMQKFSSTLCSLGMPSCYLHPGEASHGDLGLIGKEDILFITSTSGKTREVMEIMDLARNVNVKHIIGITSHSDSPVREKADFVISMGEIEEAGDLGLAPTTSILVIQCITDALALIASEEMGLTREEYGKFHHSGYCGKMARGDDKIY